MKKFFDSLFWKISFVFLFILVIISSVYMYISVTTAEMYFQETRQRLDTEIAAHIASDNDCFIGDSVNTDVLKNVFHNVMVINPSIEVYLLNTEGKILTYFAPYHEITLEYVPLDPIKEFISLEDHEFLMAIDPKNPTQKKAFSAAEVIEDGELKGYIYVILGGEEYENASQLVFGSYILRLGVRSMVFALITAAVIGFIAIGFITKNIRAMVGTIREFKNGNLNARIKTKGKGELSEFSDSFNDMADTIVSNIDEIKRIDKLRRELVANVSHDLRTPLAIIRGYIETVLIKDEKLSADERKKYLETILSSTDRLLNLVEELFELSKLEAKDKTLQLEEFPIAELLQDVYQKNLIIAESNKIKVTIELSDNLPLIKADVGMMEKVFQNLVDNALKFTPENGSIKLIAERFDNNNLSIKVIDSGIGIDKDQLPNIFDKYYQIKRVSDGKNKGTGLGLAIVKKILDLHKFDIVVDSEVNKGTSFNIIINCTLDCK